MPRITSETMETYDGGALKAPVGGVDQVYLDLVGRLVESREDERDDLLNKLFEDPHEALVAEVAYMLALYKDRTVERELSDGSTETQFATRREDEEGVQQLDDRYSIRELNNGMRIYSIRVSTFISHHSYEGGGAYREGYEAVLTDSDILTVRQVRGDYDLPIRTPEQYTRALIDIFDRTTETAKKVKKRRKDDPSGAHQADEDARELLEVDLGL